MPIYQYKNCDGDSDPDTFVERNVPIDERDNQTCRRCGFKLDRVISFTGLTWSPTRNGGFS